MLQYKDVDRASLRLRIFSASWRWRHFWFPRKTIIGFKWMLERIYFATKPKGLVRMSTYVGDMVLNCCDDVITPQILSTGEHEPVEAKVLEREIKTGQTVLDIGANNGYYSLLISKLVGKSGKVYSFEPDPKNLSLLQENLSANHCDNVQVIQKALSSESGKTTLYQDKSNYGAHSITRENLIDDGKTSVEVETSTLDAVMQAEGGRVDWIKMDIQGAEGLMLKGAQATLKKDKPDILMEFWPIGLEKMETDPLTLLEDFQSLGYSISIIDASEFSQVKDLAEILQLSKKNTHLNLLLSHPEK